MFCFGPQNRVQGKEGQELSALGGLRIHSTEKGKTKTPILNLSEFKCVPYLKMELGGEAQTSQQLCRNH